MSGPRWILDPESEEEHLIPWLGGEKDPDVAARVLRFLSELVDNPLGRGEERDGVFSAVIPKIKVSVIWLLDFESRVVVLAGVRTTG